MAGNLAQELVAALLRRTALALELVFTPPHLIGTPLPTPARGADPVVIIHGIVDSQNGSYDFANSLRRDGFTVFTPTMPAGGLDGVEANVEYLRRYIRWVLRVTGARHVDLVGHSQGGLTIRGFIRAGGEDLVDSVVTINSPHHGVAGPWRPLLDAARAIPLLAKVVPDGLLELDERSTMVRGLNAGDETPGTIRYTSIWSRDADGIVFPWTSPVLEGARNVALFKGRAWATGPHHLFVNHTNLEAFNAVRAALLEPSPAPAPPVAPRRRRVAPMSH
jgi:triacylglycerol esterase/lipase EstA (alpha/beta hydrolase family)